MKNTILVSLFLIMGIVSFSQLNFELKEIDTARVYNFHPDCNGANNAGVWEAENLVVLTENLYPDDLDYETMKVFVNFFDALFDTYVDITSSPNLPIDGGFGAYNGKPTYHITTNMCPGYAGAASHGVTGNATAMGFFDLTYDRIQNGDTSFCQVYTYEMHRNFWWGTDVWCEKIGWYVDNNPAAWGHWTLACNVANGTLLTDYLGVGVFEDPPYNDSEAFYHRNVDPFLYYLDHPEYNFDNTWLHGLLNFDWLPDTRGVNNLMTGLFIYSYENFGGINWEKGFYTWLQSDEIIPDYDYSDFQNGRDNCYRVWSMAADSSLLNFFETDIRWDISQEAIDWVAIKLNLSIIEPSALTGSVISNDEVVLSWNDNNSDETSFILERKLSTDPNFSEIQNLPANTTTFTDNVVGEYVYRIKTMNASGTSLYSNDCNINTATVRPNAPTDLFVESANSNSITIAWTQPAGTIDGSEVWVRNLDNEDESFKVVQGSDNSQYINHLDENTSYACKVRVFNAGGFSDYSEEFIAETDDVKPDKPFLKPIETLSDTKLKLRWVDHSNNEDGFLIRRKIEGDLYEVIDSVEMDIEEYVDEDLTPNTTYYYKIKSFNTIGNSESSSERFGTTWGTGIKNNLNSDELLTVFPNPANDVLHISSERVMNTIELFNYSGQLILSEQVKGNKHQLNVSDLESGTYILKVITEKGFYSEKVIVE